MNEQTPHVQDLLAAYVLDAVTPMEATLVVEHLSACATCRALAQELHEVTSMLPDLAGEVEPPAALRERLLTIVEEESRGAANVHARDAPGITVLADRAAARPSSSNRFIAPFALAAALALLLVGLSVWRHSHTATQPTSVYALQGTTAQPSISGSLAYFAADNHADLTLRGLRPLPVRRVYELWVIRGNFAVVRGVGVFRPAADGSGHLHLTGQQVPGYDLIGLTIENAPRSNVPTLPIMASGKITS